MDDAYVCDIHVQQGNIYLHSHRILAIYSASKSFSIIIL